MALCSFFCCTSRAVGPDRADAVSWAAGGVTNTYFIENGKLFLDVDHKGPLVVTPSEVQIDKVPGEQRAKIEALLIKAKVLTTDKLVVEVIPTTASNPERVAIVLPGSKYASLINENSPYSYHLLRHQGHSLLAPFEFDADQFVEDAIKYCRNADIQGVFGFDCFPSVLAAIINDSLKLSGPSFQSVYVCIHKFYMRKIFDYDMQITAIDYKDPPQAPAKFPVVVKSSCCQFYVGTKIIHDVAEWDDHMASIRSRPAKLLDRRKQFYFKWLQRLKADPRLQEAKWEDVVIWHVEPYLEGPEHQIEVVVDNNELLIADTGDIVKQGSVITMFVTPGSFNTPKDFTHDVAGKLRELGYNNQAMDIEFIFTSTGPRLVEINSRYSYMGWATYYTTHSPGEPLKSRPDLRNLVNRTCSCLGKHVPKMPSKSHTDHEGNELSKLALMMYTSKTGPIDTIIDKSFLEDYVKSGSAEAWAPKTPYLAGEVTLEDVKVYSGYAKLGCLLMTAPRAQFQKANAKIAKFMDQFFLSKSYILCEDYHKRYSVDAYAIHDMS